MGKHILLEVYDVDFNLLNDEIPLLHTIKEAIYLAGMTILNVYSHKFTPQGLTIVIALSESHFSLHSWPEQGCFTSDTYTCGPNNPKIITNALIKYFNSDNYMLRELDR
jgi:S-adenosylmethionine decarboxylase